jgi:hypothetical protein
VDATRWFVHRAEHVLEEVAALDVLHGEKPGLALREQLVQSHEVRVMQIGERAELALEAVDAERVDTPQRLERDLGFALPIERQIHRAHAAFTKAALDREAIAPEQAAIRIPKIGHEG